MKKLLLFVCCLIGAATILQAGPKKEFVVLLHAAHGGTAKGVEVAGVLEKDLTLAYAKELQKLAVANDFKVVMARAEDKNFDFATLPELAKQNKADIVISIHFNANPADESNRGMECYVATQTATMENKALGKFIGAGLYSVNGMKFNGVNIKQIGTPLNQFSNPVALLKLGYLTNEKDLAFVKTEAGKQDICQKLLNAIVRYKAHIESNK